MFTSGIGIGKKSSANMSRFKLCVIRVYGYLRVFHRTTLNE